MAIFILKKDDPQIKASNTKRKRSIDLASLISSLDCICVKNAYLPLLYNISKYNIIDISKSLMFNTIFIKFTKEFFNEF